MEQKTKRKWLAIIQKQQQSGLSAAQFCRNESINQKYFSTCKRQLLKELENSSPVFTRIETKHYSRQDIAFEYQYENSILKFNQLPDPKWLSQLLSTLS